MMLRLGTDLVHIPRIAGALERFGDRFLQRIYTTTEQQDCGCLPPQTPNINQLAGRWAAKEAVAKALLTGFRGFSYTDIEIRRQANGAPQISLHGNAAALSASLGKCQWQLSLSHDRDYCVATVLLICECSLPNN
ncbi:MAG: holo-ACP synthase [Coleofasciculaceae cyanobacterium]